jgi:hypothetical protein
MKWFTDIICKICTNLNVALQHDDIIIGTFQVVVTQPHLPPESKGYILTVTSAYQRLDGSVLLTVIGQDHFESR